MNRFFKIKFARSNVDELLRWTTELHQKKRNTKISET